MPGIAGKSALVRQDWKKPDEHGQYPHEEQCNGHQEHFYQMNKLPVASSDVQQLPSLIFYSVDTSFFHAESTARLASTSLEGGEKYQHYLIKN